MDTCYVDDLFALDMLHRAERHLASQFNISMPRDQAQSNVDARAIIFRCRNKILIEHGLGISRKDVEIAMEQIRYRMGIHRRGRA